MGLLNWLFGPNSLFRKAASSAVDAVFSPTAKAYMIQGLGDWVTQRTPKLASTHQRVLIGLIPEIVDEAERLAREKVK